MNTNKLIESSKYRIEEFKVLQDIGMIPLNGEFYPAGVHYPPITMYPNVDQDSFFDGYTPLEKGVYDIYVHIPFCKKRCWFCHYPSKYSAKESDKDLYLDFNCNLPCKTCIPKNNTGCQTCFTDTLSQSKGLPKHLLNNYCIETCPLFYYSSSKDYACQKCYDNKNCLRCKDGE